MMFYGDVRKKNRPLADFRSDLLRHFIVALQVLQKEGNLLLKVILLFLTNFLAREHYGLLFSECFNGALKYFQSN